MNTENENMTQLGDWLNELMINRGWRQADLARATGISRSGISLLLNGQIRPAPQTIMQLSQALRIKPEIIMEKAGYLPERIEKGDPELNEANYKLSLLTLPNRKLVFDYIDFILDREKDEKDNIGGMGEPNENTADNSN